MFGRSLRSSQVKFLHTWPDVMDAYVLLRGPGKRDYWYVTFCDKMMKTPEGLTAEVKEDGRVEVLAADVEAFATSGPGDDRVFTKDSFGRILEFADRFADPSGMLAWIERQNGWFLGKGAKRDAVRRVLDVMERREWKGVIWERCHGEERLVNFLGHGLEGGGEKEEGEVVEKKRRSLVVSGPSCGVPR